MSFIVLDERPSDDIAKLKVVLPYCISNRSHNETLRVRQVLDKKHAQESSHARSFDDDSKAEDEQGLPWHVLPPQSELPFCWDEPLLEDCRLQVQVALVDEEEKEEKKDDAAAIGRAGGGRLRPKIVSWTSAGSSDWRSMDLEEFDSEHSYVDFEHKARSSSLLSLPRSLAPLAMSRRQASPTHQRLYYFSEQFGPTNFVVFSDQPSDAWKKRQLRERKDNRERAEREGVPLAASDNATKPKQRWGGSVAEEEKEFVVTEGEKAALTRQGGAQATGKIAVQTDAQKPVNSTCSRCRLGLCTTHLLLHPCHCSLFHVTVICACVCFFTLCESKAGVPSLQSGDDLHVEVGERAPSPLGPSLRGMGAAGGSSIGANPRALASKVAQLRVQVLSARNLRAKDKHLFAKVIFGNQIRQTNSSKKAPAPDGSGDEQVHWEQELTFSADDIGQQLFAQWNAHTQHAGAKESHAAAAPQVSLGVTSPTAVPSSAVSRSRLPLLHFGRRSSGKYIFAQSQCTFFCGCAHALSLSPPVSHRSAAAAAKSFGVQLLLER
jgi:hypothetical protein